MKTKTIDKILELFQTFQKNLEVRPSLETMYEEVRMMRFKIKPIQGDVGLLNLNNQQLIEVLWQLGKLEEFFQKQFNKLTPAQKEVFFNFFSEMHNKFQNKLNQLNLKSGKNLPTTASFFEMEIIKERQETKKPN